MSDTLSPAERESLYADVFRFIADGLFIFQVMPDGAVTVETYNPVIERLIGQSATEASGRRLGELLPDDKWDPFEERIRDCMASGRSTVYEQRHRFPGRQGIWMATLTRIGEADGSAKRVLGSLRDVTREREAEVELRKSWDRHSTLFEHSPFNLAVIGLLPDGGFIYEDANTRLLESLGFARDGFVNRRPEEIFEPETAAYVTRHYRQCVAAKATVDFEVIGQVPIGRVIRRTVLVPLLDDDGEVAKIFVSSIDLSRQRRMEEQLHQAQRLEAVGQLTGGIAHDFNNLLTVVLGNLDMLRRAEPERAPRLIDNAVNAVEHGRKLTSQLLAFSRRQALKPEVIDLQSLIRSMGDMLTQSLRGDISIAIDLADDLWPVEVDPAQLQAVLINLAANARDAMPKGGRFTICVRNTVFQHDGPVECVSVEVGDTGVGISPDALQKVFEPFYTTKPVGQGTGLGLAQVYGFVQQSGGWIDIKSEVGQGTTVSLLLRRTNNAQAEVSSDRELEPIGTHSPLSILIVEDNLQVADIALALLREQGHQVEHCSSAPDALRALDRNLRFDIIFSDLVMPGGMDGLDFARIVRDRWPFMPILLATGYSESAERATKEGFLILKKPYRPSELYRALRTVIAQTSDRSNVLPLRPRRH
ncbi:PAS domain-containing protein [Microvirga zambiensis]|uniref:PAS domain-containing protein n=1 Tax=Microvirga zambiensis TaxID=1402137 RepID=UPI00191D7EE3